MRNDQLGQNARSANAPMCIIVEPTKELAQQTHEQIESFSQFLDHPKIRFVLTTSVILILLETFLFQAAALFPIRCVH